MHSSPRDTGAIIAHAPVLSDAFKEVGWSTGLISTKLYRGYADNWELSQARALSVVRFLTDELEFPPQRLAAAGFGEYRPAVEGDTPEARTRNRRIELKLTER